MNRILLTGFTTWGKEHYNSSWEMLKDCTVSLPEGWQCDTALLPVSWTQAPRVLEERLTSDVKAVVCFGMAGGDAIRVERIATNILDNSIPVIDGVPHSSEFVCPGGPPAYWTGLPYEEMLTSLEKHEINCRQSLWAGGFLCNFIFYWLMHQISSNGLGIVGGFVHVPPLEDRGGMPRERLSLAANVVARSVVSSIERKR